MRTLLALLLLVTPVLSGCLSEPVEEPEPRPVARRNAAVTAATPESGPDVALVELIGRTTTYGCVISPAATQCHAVLGGEDLQPFGDARDTALRLLGNLTWNAATPATGQLNAYLVVDGRYQYGYPVAYGESPVSVDFDLRPYQGHALAIGVSSTSCTCSSTVGAVHAAPQDFMFRGAFIFEARESAAKTTS